MFIVHSLFLHKSIPRLAQLEFSNLAGRKRCREQVVHAFGLVGARRGLVELPMARGRHRLNLSECTASFTTALCSFMVARRKRFNGVASFIECGDTECL